MTEPSMHFYRCMVAETRRNAQSTAARPLRRRHKADSARNYYGFDGETEKKQHLILDRFKRRQAARST